MSSQKYLHEIDSLRALAVVAVILNHFEKSWLPGGFLGVDIFFVISGFVVTSSLQSQNPTSFRSFISNFYLKRIKRLYPALLVCLALSLLVLGVLFPVIKPMVQTAKYSILGLANFQLYQGAQDYFSTQATSNPFTHMWSLGVEEQFYFVFPILFFLCRSNRRRFILFNSIFVLLSVAAFIILKLTDEMFAFYMMPTRYWQLGLGALIAASRLTGLLRSASRHLAIIPLVIVMACLTLTPQFSLIPTLIVTLATGFLLAFIKETPERPYLTQRPLLQIGKLSYSLYLYHWPLIVIFRETISLRYLGVVCLLILGFSLASYYLVENRFRRQEWQGFEKGIITAILLMVLLAALKPDATLHRAFIGKAEVKYSIWKDQPTNFKQDCVLSGNAKLPFSTSERAIEHLSSKCQVLKLGAKNSVFAIGNSYVEEKLPYLLTQAQTRGMNLYTMIAPGAYLFPFEAISKRHKKTRSKFLWGTFLDPDSEIYQSGDTIILSTPLQDFLTSESRFFDGNSKPVTASDAFKIFIRELISVRDKLQARGVTLQMLGAYPLLRTDVTPAHCYQPWSKLNAKCNYENIFDEAKSQEIRTLDLELSKSLGSSYVSLFERVQSAARAQEFPARLYHNSSHLNAFANTLF